MTADPFAGMTSETAEAKLDAAFGPLPGPAAGSFSPADQFGIAEATAKASRYLAAAHHAGLPEPTYITISAGDPDFESYSDIGLQFTAAAKVRAWAAHFGVKYRADETGATRAKLPSPERHGVHVYCGSQWAVPEVPGLAEHTQAATCQHEEIDQLGDCAGCGLNVKPELAEVPADADSDFSSVPGLAAHTEAACDTIKAASE